MGYFERSRTENPAFSSLNNRRNKKPYVPKMVRGSHSRRGRGSRSGRARAGPKVRKLQKFRQEVQADLEDGTVTMSEVKDEIEEMVEDAKEEIAIEAAAEATKENKSRVEKIKQGLDDIRRKIGGMSNKQFMFAVAGTALGVVALTDLAKGGHGKKAAWGALTNIPRIVQSKSAGAGTNPSGGESQGTSLQSRRSRRYSRQVSRSSSRRRRHRR